MPNPEMEVRSAHASKPDPSEPWRYVCPNCKAEVHRSKRGFKYRCDHCEESFEKGELYDKNPPIA